MRTEKQRQYNREHYKNNVQYYVSKAKKRRDEVRKKYLEYLKTLKCEICSESDWRCLEFDHLDASTKVDCVSSLIRKDSWTKVEQEIKKMQSSLC